MQNSFAIKLTTPLNNINMSNALVTLVPVLSGANYNEWSSAMEAYLLSMGQWKAIELTLPVVGT